MDKRKMTNSFSALSLLDADAADGDHGPPSSSGKGVKTGGGSGEKVGEEMEILNDKSPLVWIDLEMTVSVISIDVCTVVAMRFGRNELRMLVRWFWYYRHVGLTVVWNFLSSDKVDSASSVLQHICCKYTRIEKGSYVMNLWYHALFSLSGNNKTMNLFSLAGLNAEVDRILEIACVITDGKLNHSVEGPNLVIGQTQKCLDQMDKWNQEHHGASGLKAAVLKSEVTEQEAERQVMEFVKRYVGERTAQLAGNSVYTDLIFLKSSVHVIMVKTLQIAKFSCLLWDVNKGFLGSQRSEVANTTRA
ncbi:Oligoribonuclease-like protein [Drosera capensis]